ncbi:MAG: asparagine synthase (glutamine-hydrolyzing) [Clostridiales bacterium]|nr:asparagine synthase (glutamine-hydrolyzing) [Clostridiales bacterium]
MCGIAGWTDNEQNLKDYQSVISDMSETLSRRGPDAEGVYFGENICLIHRRLIVIDPENGKQPMSYENGATRYIIVYNGELYNTPAIRSELESLGYSFKGHCDTEVLLLSFVHWGEKCLEKLNGIFAFAIWDEEKKSLFLARDRMGVKPLFFYQYKDGFIFASQIKTLLKNPHVRPEIDEDSLKEVFLLGPARTCGNGIIKGIRELCPGECAFYDRNGLKVKKYWTLKAQEHTDNLNQTIEKTRHLITNAITGQLVSDVPLCCFLSGGLDSSIITKLASDHYKATNKDALTTYSVDYKDNQKYFVKSVFQPNSDMEYIKTMVYATGSSHREVVLDNGDLADALTASTIARDLPGMADVDSSLLLFCEQIKRNYTVALSGECADEVFGGYPWYHNKSILFEETFPWSRSLSLRQNILKKGVLKNGEEYVHQKYSDTISRTSSLPNESRLSKRMRQMFMLNLEWFMQTLLERNVTKQNVCERQNIKLFFIYL